MMTKYSGGDVLTEFLLTMSGLEPCRILDLGAGNGETVRMLLEQGFFAEGTDEVLPTAYEDGSFDAVICEGICYGSGRKTELWQEALRLLKQGGMLLLADVCFTDTKGHVAELENAGYQVEHVEDASALWAEFGLLEQVELLGGRGRCRYFLSVCTKL